MDGGEQLYEVDGDVAGVAVSHARGKRLRVVVATLTMALVVAASVAWISAGSADPKAEVSAVGDGGLPPSTGLTPIEPDDVVPSTTVSTTSTTRATSAATAVGTPGTSGLAPRQSNVTPGSSPASTSLPTPTTAVREPSREIFLHDVTVSPATVTPGGTITVSWRLVSEISIDQTFFYLSFPEGWSFDSDDGCRWMVETEPVSGTDRDGTYRVPCRLPEDTPPFTFGVHVMALHDRQDTSQARFWHNQAHFTVTAPPSTTTTSSTPPTSP